VLLTRFLNLSADELDSLAVDPAVIVDAVEECVDEEDNPGLVFADFFILFLSEGSNPP